MRCIRVHRARRACLRAAAMLVLGGAMQRASAQQYPAPTYPQQPYPGYPAYPGIPQYPPVQPGGPALPPNTALPAYRPPLIAVAQPGDGIALPDAKPIAVFRFASGELLDPLDALSFTVAVDGVDRTSLFQLTQGEAWGRLAMAGELLTAGQHDVRARICTAHGACGTTKATVNIVPAAAVIQLGATSTASPSKAQRAGRVLDAVLQAARILIR